MGKIFKLQVTIGFLIKPPEIEVNTPLIIEGLVFLIAYDNYVDIANRCRTFKIYNAAIA